MQLKDILTLQRIPGIGNQSLLTTINFCRVNDIESLTYFESKPVTQLPIKGKPAENLYAFLAEGLYGKTLSIVESDLETWHFLDIRVVVVGDPHYPTQLTSVKDHPAILFC